MMQKSRIEFPPGPSSHIPGKIVRSFLKDPINTLSKIAEEYGDLSHFKLRRMHIYLINNPDYIEKILIYDHGNFSKGPRLQIAKRLLGEGLVTSEGEFHKSQRKLILCPGSAIFRLEEVLEDVLENPLHGRREFS